MGELLVYRRVIVTVLFDTHYEKFSIETLVKVFIPINYKVFITVMKDSLFEVGWPFPVVFAMFDPRHV